MIKENRPVAFIILILTCLMLFMGDISHSSSRTPLYKEENTGEAFVFTEAQSKGVRFNISVPFSAIILNVNRVYSAERIGGVCLSLYKWDKSYLKTTNGQPIASIDHTGIRTSKEYALSFSKDMDAGDYLFTLESLSGSWSISVYDEAKDNVAFYENGLNVSKAFPISIDIAKSQDNIFAKLSKEEKITDNLDIRPETWRAVDGLGRWLSSSSKAKSDDKDRFVGIFYWSASGYWSQHTNPYNITEISRSVSKEVFQAAKNDYKHEIWKTPNAASWFWDEPLFGYYNTNDDYVLRKHAELLADARVDVILFDTCVGLSTTSSYMNVFEVFAKAREQGVNTPDIAFVLPMGDAKSCAIYIRQLYEEIYSKGLYKDLWFYWADKPLILAYYNQLDDNGIDGEIKKFFTFRRADAWSWRNGDADDLFLVGETDKSLNNNKSPDIVGPKDYAMWGWLNTYPQTKYYYREGGKLVLEFMTVGVAQNVDTVSYQPTAMNGTNVAGRSYTYGKYSYSYILNGNKVTIDEKTQDAVLYGLNFQQQWDYAIEADPAFIFVTGWNEWTAGRYEDFLGVENAFPDQFDYEYSRDVEPSAGILKDHYYYQLVENIRRFKGISEDKKTETKNSIDINGNLSQWDKISSYDHYVASTWLRDNPGYKDTYYKNNTMRNDIIRSKVAFDEYNIYFYVECLQDISDYKNPAWMRLFIDTDFTGKSKNWEGFEYIVNRPNPDEKTCLLEKSLGIDESGNWKWEELARLNYRVTGNILQIEIPRDCISLDKQNVSFNFKWSDNMQNDGDIMDFYKNGDVAPGGRFMFHFSGKGAKGTIQSILSPESNKLVIIAISLSAAAIALVIIASIFGRKKKNSDGLAKVEYIKTEKDKG